jgi:membrane protease subunit HflC
MRAFLATIVVLLGLAALGVYFSLFIVHQNEQVLVLEFGKPTRVIQQPGLHWKIPVVETVDYFDKRILDMDSQPQEVTASDQKRLVVDAFTRYKIIDPLRFFQNVSD